MSKCLSLVKGRRIRVTRLDACGRPIYGEDSVGVSKGFISVASTANTTDSDEIRVTNAAGEVCVFEPSETSLTGYGLEIAFCEVDVEIFSLITGQEPYTNAAGEAIGFTVNTKLEVKTAFALELWAGVSGGDACANPDAQGNYGYILYPFVSGGIVGDFTVENGAVTFTLTGANTKDGNSWGVGPYDVILDGATPAAPGPLPEPLDPNDALLVIAVDVAPPDAVCGLRPLLDPAEEPLTSIVGTPTGLSVSYALLPADLTSSVYIEFGDGTWDYVAGSAAPIVHVYDKPGTYTVSASTNGVYVTADTVVTGP